MVSVWGVYGLNITSRFSTAPVAAVFGWKSKWRARCHFPGCRLPEGFNNLCITLFHLAIDLWSTSIHIILHLHSTMTRSSDQNDRTCLNARHYLLDLSNISHSAWSLNLAHMRMVGSQPLKNLPVHRRKSDAQLSDSPLVDDQNQLV